MAAHPEADSSKHSLWKEADFCMCSTSSRNHSLYIHTKLSYQNSFMSFMEFFYHHARSILLPGEIVNRLIVRVQGVTKTDC